MHFRKHYFSKLVFGGVVIIVDGDDVVLSHLFLIVTSYSRLEKTLSFFIIIQIKKTEQ